MVGSFAPPNISHKDSPTLRIKFNEWSSFLDLDHFNSSYLIETLSTKGSNSLPFMWTDSKSPLTCKSDIPVTALRQAEAIFNLSQLMFALYHGSISACTFLDLQLNRPPRDIRKHGFAVLDSPAYIQSGASFRQALHTLCWQIAESGGLAVVFSMMQNPVLPIIRQKCLDALTNILCVENIEKIVLERQPWFLEKLVSLIDDGDLQCDMVPAVSVLDRLVVVILSENMKVPYEQLIKLDFISICMRRLHTEAFTCPNIYLHFVKFRTIAMQAVALMCANVESAKWQLKHQEQVFMYSYRSILLWDTDKPPTDPYVAPVGKFLPEYEF
uniref:Uncharacterized protein n=1 Tax=Ciona savignyi TaxID=51511 RepID=H2Y8L7_CIOSA